MNNKYIILTESDKTDDITDKKDLEFLIKHELIKIKSGSIIPKFVGEVRTPNNIYFSLPNYILFFFRVRGYVLL
jgi:hypothetical protein